MVWYLPFAHANGAMPLGCHFVPLLLIDLGILTKIGVVSCDDKIM